MTKLYSTLLIIMAMCIRVEAIPILIITTAYNHPDLIEFQYKCFKKFLKDEFKFCVFNDAVLPKYKKEIELECEKLNINCYNVPQHIHSTDWLNLEHFIPITRSALRHSESIRYAFEVFDYYKDGIIAICDSDCFLISDLSIKEYLGDSAISCMVFRETKDKIDNLMSPICSFFNMKKLPYPKSMILEAGFIGHNFKDPFNMLGYYLNAHPECVIKHMSLVNLDDIAPKDANLYPDFVNKTNFIKDFKDCHKRYSVKIPFLSLLIANKFIHLGQGSIGTKLQEEKINIFKAHARQLIK